MDAFAVSISNGITLKNIRLRHVLLVSFFFGGFQGIMPILGFYIGSSFSKFISHIDYLVAFFLLAFIGGKMIYESLVINSEDNKEKNVCLNVRRLICLSVATSIDAFAVGVSFSVLGYSIVKPAVVISIITFIMSFTGMIIGDKAGHFFEKKIELVGGFILIGIGIKFLIDHFV